MADETSNSPAEIKETDIVFDCPFCSKSLAIDYRGAGLTIPCTDCGKLVEVPIPEGMELSDFDSSEGDQEVRIVQMRKSLAAAHARIAQLEVDVASRTAKQASLEETATTSMYRLQAILDKVCTLQQALKQVEDTVAEIMKAETKA